MSTESSDFIQSTLLHAVRARDARAWQRLVRLFSPLFYDWCRRQGLQASDAAWQIQMVPDEEPSDATGDSDSSLTHSPHVRALELMREHFEERTWTAFWRVAMQRENTADVAADLGMTAAAVRKAKARVLRRLREEFGELLD